MKLNRDCPASVCPLTAGSLKGVPVLPLTAGHTSTAEKKTACCLFSYLAVRITANSGLPVLLQAHSDTVVPGNTLARPAPAALQRSSLKCLKRAFVCSEPSVSCFTFLLTKLLQLLSQLRRITHT